MSTQTRRRHKARVHEVALRSALKAAVKSHRSFMAEKMGIFVLKTPPGYTATEYGNSLNSYLNPDNSRRNDFGFMYIRAEDKPFKVLDTFQEDCLSKLYSLVVVEEGASIPTVVQAAADAVIDLRPISVRDIRLACRAELGLRLSENEAEKLLAYPLAYLWAALRPGRGVQQVLDRLARLPIDFSEAPDKPKDDLPALENMHGYGVAKNWGLELSQDLTDWREGTIAWSDVDKGIILSGPPGTGKTAFAKALAKQCNVNLIATSLGQWQATGHLGDLLKAMRRDFTRARNEAPSIIFIDEVDSVGDRSKFTHDNSNYSVQVVNCLLENLDGLDRREGVVVVAATNDISRIDPAILRAGRLDRHVEISLPTGEDRIAILAQHIEHCVPVEQLISLKLVTAGMSGADLAKTARDAKRLARRQRRPVAIDDLKASLPAVHEIADEHRKSIAIHEAGHTIVGVELKYGTYLGTTVANFVRSDSIHRQGGAAHFEIPPVARRSKQFYLDCLAVMLAGLAAEELCLGSISDGAGGGENSDLAIATRIATVAEAKLGMGETFLHSTAETDNELEKLRLSDPDLRSRVDRILTEQFHRAKNLLHEKRNQLDLLANELNAVGFLLPERVADLARSTAFSEAPEATENHPRPS